MFNWIKKNKIWLIIIGVLTSIITVLSSILSLIFLGKDSKDNNIITQTEQEIKDVSTERSDIQNNVDNSVTNVSDIKSKVF